MANLANQLIEEVRAKVGNGRVVAGLSGGVDSSVAATLVHKAIGDRLTCIFVDHGLLRLNEAEEVMGFYRNEIGLISSKSMQKIASFQNLQALRNPSASAR